MDLSAQDDIRAELNVRINRKQASSKTVEKLAKVHHPNWGSTAITFGHVKQQRVGLVRRYGLPNSPKKLIPGDVRKKEWLTGELDTKKGTIRSRRGPVQTQQYAFRLGPSKNLRCFNVQPT
uniref:AlNc14C80G5244 protein n=1 Tax=Albugo laibachii Nc14 TaxID=890382 RepID=F0WF50_9STRA|nr:AlNc14C80G5244 [Albugo laibachii Nc14]|eukprot:CCA19832.1 AlNc14C80G5244 [Albugo laibachii Nc14]